VSGDGVVFTTRVLAWGRSALGGRAGRFRSIRICRAGQSAGRPELIRGLGRSGGACASACLVGSPPRGTGLARPWSRSDVFRGRGPGRIWRDLVAPGKGLVPEQGAGSQRAGGTGRWDPGIPDPAGWTVSGPPGCSPGQGRSGGARRGACLVGNSPRGIGPRWPWGRSEFSEAGPGA